MKILDILDLLTKEKAFRRTPKGRALSDFAIQAVEATLADKKNYEMEVIQCLGCGFVVSSLLVSDGCPNCGAIDMTENVIDK
jgi:hypothetical protein